MRVAVMKFIGAALLCLVLMPPAFAQTAPPYTPPTQTYSVTTGSGSSASAMPVPAVGGPLPYGLFQNIGSNPISFALGNTNGITVTPGTTIPTIQGGSCQLLFVGNTPGFIALQSVGGSSTLQVTLQYGQGPLPVSCPGASGSGVISGTVTANQGTAAATASAWPVTLAIGGALNSITNPVFVAPSTGATFGVTGTVGLSAGSALAGKFGIDQTTPVTTNGIVVAPTSASAAGITPIVSASAEGSHVLKGSPGNLYSLYVTTGATSGYVMTFNATTAPADGAVTPIECVPVFATSTLGLTFGSGPPDVYSTGITAVFSSTGCFTKTVSATAFFKARVM